MRFADDRRLPAFPAQCEVRGCEAPPQEWHEVGPHVFEVCHVHGLQLRAGETYTLSGGEVLVGQDSASELIDARRSITPTGTLLTLAIGHHGIVEHEIPMVIGPRQRHVLRSLLGDRDDPQSCS